jgi:hypothetical protein
MLLGLVVFPVLTLLAAAGLHAIAPHHYRGEYLLPAARTVAVITTAAAFVAAVWSH